jgi:hypothetical protein
MYMLNRSLDLSHNLAPSFWTTQTSGDELYGVAFLHKLPGYIVNHQVLGAGIKVVNEYPGAGRESIAGRRLVLASICVAFMKRISVRQR